MERGDVDRGVGALAEALGDRGAAEREDALDAGVGVGGADGHLEAGGGEAGPSAEGVAADGDLVEVVVAAEGGERGAGCVWGVRSEQLLVNRRKPWGRVGGARDFWRLGLEAEGLVCWGLVGIVLGMGVISRDGGGWVGR